MPRFLLVLGGLVAFTASVSAGMRNKVPLPPEGTKNLALVIGNRENDARAVAERFRMLGFWVTEWYDLKSDGMRKIASDFAAIVADTPGANVLVYFSGTAVQVGHQDYLLAPDVPRDSAEAAARSGLKVEDLVSQLSAAALNGGLVICDGGRVALDQVPPEELPPPSGPLAVWFSSAPGQPILEDSEGHGAFVQAFLQSFPPRESQGDPLASVNDSVVKATQGRQVPVVIRGTGVSSGSADEPSEPQSLADQLDGFLGQGYLAVIGVGTSPTAAISTQRAQIDAQARLGADLKRELGALGDRLAASVAAGSPEAARIKLAFARPRTVLSGAVKLAEPEITQEGQSKTAQVLYGMVPGALADSLWESVKTADPTLWDLLAANPVVLELKAAIDLWHRR